MAAFAGIFV